MSGEHPTHNIFNRSRFVFPSLQFPPRVAMSIVLFYCCCFCTLIFYYYLCFNIYFVHKRYSLDSCETQIAMHLLVRLFVVKKIRFFFATELQLRFHIKCTSVYILYLHFICSHAFEINFCVYINFQSMHVLSL
jgi:hypothetical protein